MPTLTGLYEDGNGITMNTDLKGSDLYWFIRELESDKYPEIREVR